MTKNKHKKIAERFSPIIAPLWWRICKDYWLLVSACIAALFSFHWLFVTFLPLYGEKYRIIRSMRRLPKFMRGIIGDDVFHITSTTSLGSFAYLHPISLTILMSFAIILSSWTIAGQIDRGTMDLILSTPRPRWKYAFTSIFAGLLGGALLIGSMLLGTWIGVQRTALPEPYHYNRIILCAANLYALYIVVLGVGMFLSSISSIRSWAVGWGIAISVISYLLHFFSEWWEFVRKASTVGPLNYFHPIKIAIGYDPTRDIIVLTAAGLSLCIASIICFSRRDIAVL